MHPSWKMSYSFWNYLKFFISLPQKKTCFTCEWIKMCTNLVSRGIRIYVLITWIFQKNIVAIKNLSQKDNCFQMDLLGILKFATTMSILKLEFYV